jgi:signal transduction histidine kinase
MPAPEPTAESPPGAQTLREELALAALDAAPISVALIDLEHGIVLTNPHFEQTFGAAAGRPCYQIFKGLEAPCEECPLALARRQGSPTESEERGQTPDGEEAIWNVRAIPLAGSPYVAHLSLDVTQLHGLTERLAQTEQLATVGLTVAGLAHSIKNILAGLDGGIYVVNSGMQRDNVERVKGGWELVQRYIEQVSTLVQNLLSYVRPEGRTKEAVPPQELVDAAVELYQSKAALAGVELDGLLEGELPALWIDRASIEACLTNLVTNALDACLYDPADDKQHRILVRARRHRGKLAGVIFEVSDNGMGIAEQDQRKILKALHTTKGIRGTGLGLLMTRQAVEAHGGRVTFTSEQGAGTTFCIVLPEGQPRESNPNGGADEQEDPRHR